MKLSACIKLSLLLASFLPAAGVSGASLLTNPGFEDEGPAGLATNWWYYGPSSVGRASWANRNVLWGNWGNAFYAAGNAYGGFGSDVTVDSTRGSVFTFQISGKGELNYTNENTTVGMEFWSGASFRYAITQNVYQALAASRDQWVFLTLTHTNTDASVNLVKVRCDFAGGLIPSGTSLATCQWDDGRLYQGVVRTASVPQQAKFEPLAGAYLGIVLDRGGTAASIQEVNQKAGRRHAVYAKFLVFKQDAFPWDWVNMVKTNCPGAGLHLVLEPMVDFEDFYAPTWGPGQETYDAALSFATNCAAAGVPIFLRFAHEANGDWYPWHPQFSERYGIPDTVSNETYIAGFRNFANLVHANASNVVMVWAPNQGNGPDPLPFYEDVYPGDEYVDWVGLSIYNGWSYGNSNEVLDFQFRNAVQKGYWQQNEDHYDDTFEDFYWTFSDPDNPVGHHKPMMIAETAAAFEPKYVVSNEILIAGFESLSGPDFTASSTIAQFQGLNNDGVAVTNESLLEAFESTNAWNWGPWSDMYFSNSAVCVQGTNAVRLGAKASFGSGEYVGGNGRSLSPATNVSACNGFVLQVRREEAGVLPILVIGFRSPGATATVSRAIVSTTYAPLKVAFNDMTFFGPFSWTNVDGVTLELITSQTGQRPADVFVDGWMVATLTNESYVDQDWWPQGTNDVPWGDGTDSAGGWHTWTVVEDPVDGYPANAVRLGGLDANSNFYIGGNGFSLRDGEKDWSGAGCLSLLARRGDMTNAEPLLAISLRDASGARTAQVSQVIVSTDYLPLRIPFADMAVTPGFEWTNVSAVVFELLSGTAGGRASDVYLKELQIGSVTNVYEQDWWMAGSGYQPWGDSTWTQTTDAAVGTYALQISGVITNSSQWYIGGNGCSMAIPQQNWSSSEALVLYGKQAQVEGRVQPKFKITLDNDYAETNGNEAVVETKVANTNYYEMVIAFEDFTVDEGFAWTNVRMFKIELFTGEAGKQPNDLFLDHIRRAEITLTNGEENIKWKHDWCDQLYALENFQDANPADPDEYPDYVNIFEHFRNIHMINWFHVKKFEDGFTKDLKIAEDGSGGVVYASYYNRIKDVYFLTNMVTDVDGDGLPDSWELQYFDGVTNADAGTDSDDDSFSNWDEYLCGTQPMSEFSLFELSPAGSVVTNAGGGFVLEWGSATNRLYAIDRSTNLLSGFSEIATAISSTPPMNTYTDTVNGAGPFMYRVRIRP